MTTIPLYEIRPHSVTRPKGLAPYRPQARTRATVDRIGELYERMRAADALPFGPRQVGYRLKELFPGQYAKDEDKKAPAGAIRFKSVEEIVKRMQQGGLLPWRWVSDASAVTYEVGGWRTLDDYVKEAPDRFGRDRRAGQRIVVELYAEAKETLPLIHRLGVERGVTVYSGSGSAGPNLARKVASRALHRAVEYDQATLLFGVCDFDQAGIRNVLRPHVEHVSSFLYGTAGNENVLGSPAGPETELVTMAELNPEVEFRQLALTPEQALAMVDSDQDQAAVRRYLDSGTCSWSRDLDLLDGVQKVELEALDPVELRRIVVEAIDAALDGDQLRRVEAEETEQRSLIADALAGLDGGGPRDW